MKARLVQGITVVLIIGAAAWIYYLAHQPRPGPFAPPGPSARPLSGFFQADLLSDWHGEVQKQQQARKQAQQHRETVAQHAREIVAVTLWMGQPQGTMAVLGPYVELSAYRACQHAQQARLTKLLMLALLHGAGWESANAAALVGLSTGCGGVSLAGPLPDALAVISQPELRSLALAGSEDLELGVVRMQMYGTTSNSGGQKTWTETFTGSAAEADRLLRALRTQIAARAQQLGATLQDPEESVTEGRLESFSCRYVHEQARGRVEVRLKRNGLPQHYKLFLHMEETQD
jgi:hypothetical protein